MQKQIERNLKRTSCGRRILLSLSQLDNLQCKENQDAMKAFQNYQKVAMRRCESFYHTCYLAQVFTYVHRCRHRVKRTS